MDIEKIAKRSTKRFTKKKKFVEDLQQDVAVALLEREKYFDKRKGAEATFGVKIARQTLIRKSKFYYDVKNAPLEDPEMSTNIPFDLSPLYAHTEIESAILRDDIIARIKREVALTLVDDNNTLEYGLETASGQETYAQAADRLGVSRTVVLNAVQRVRDRVRKNEKLKELFLELVRND